VGWDNEPEVQEMHPKTATVTMSAHVRDLQRLMHRESGTRRRRRLVWIRRSH
jgi:hypothetical protein